MKSKLSCARGGVVCSLFLSLACSQVGLTAVISYGNAINPGGASGYAAIMAVTQNTNQADWLTVSSMGVRANFYHPTGSAFDPDWYDGVIAPGTITYVWSRMSFGNPVGGLYFVMGSHRYTEAGVPQSLPESFASIFVPYY